VAVSVDLVVAHLAAVPLAAEVLQVVGN